MSLSVRLVATLVCLGSSLTAVSAETQWVAIHSPHFFVVTDAGDKRGRDAAVRFEQMRAVFGSLMNKAKINTPVPLQIVAFRNSKELRQFAPIFQGKSTEIAGLFLGSTDRCYILLDMSTENPWQVVFHEYAHQLMNGTLSIDLDPWFEEGLAEYFRSITVNGKEADVGRIPDDEYAVLARSSWIKVADLFRVQHQSKTYNESGDRRTVFYAESSMLVHYIYDNDMLAKVSIYFDLVRNKHVPVENAIQQAFGKSAPQFDRELHEYVNSNRFKYYKLEAPARIDGKAYSSAPLAEPDARAVLAEVHLHLPDYQKLAREEFEAVLQIDPNNAAALRGLGYSYLIQGNFAKSSEYFHKSARLNPNDPRVLYYSALLSQEQGLPAGGNSSQLESMRDELERSVKLDPEFADAYSLLAFTYSSQGKLGSAIITLRKAIELNPRNEQYRFNLAHLYLQASSFNAATSILRTLQTSSDPQIAARATEELAETQNSAEQSRAGPNPTRDLTGEPLTNRNPAPQSGSVPVSPTIAAAKFLKGKLLSVDCSNPPAAILTILSGPITWKMRTADINRAIIIGAAQLSCEWKNQQVAVNYREAGDGRGDIISLELQ